MFPHYVVKTLAVIGVATFVWVGIMLVLSALGNRLRKDVEKNLLS